jgi:hypothetical protein
MGMLRATIFEPYGSVRLKPHAIRRLVIFSIWATNYHDRITLSEASEYVCIQGIGSRSLRQNRAMCIEDILQANPLYPVSQIIKCTNRALFGCRQFVQFEPGQFVYERVDSNSLHDR